MSLHGVGFLCRDDDNRRWRGATATRFDNLASLARSKDNGDALARAADG
jgi:hypothetical protein